jgi:thiamine pyrophosphokinase
MSKPDKKFLVVADGALNCDWLKNLNLSDVERIVAADGGAKELLACGKTPDTVIGDLDSLTKETKKRLKNTEIIFEPSQDINDLEKALLYCMSRGANQLILLGVTGKRLDHAINNFSVLAKYDQIFKFEIYDQYSQIFLVRNSFSFSGEIGQIISLIPMGKVTGITTHGLQYPLKNESLEIGIREGVSNAINQSPFSVTVKTGLLLVFVNRVI